MKKFILALALTQASCVCVGPSIIPASCDPVYPDDSAYFDTTRERVYDIDVHMSWKRRCDRTTIQAVYSAKPLQKKKLRCLITFGGTESVVDLYDGKGEMFDMGYVYRSASPYSVRCF